MGRVLTNNTASSYAIEDPANFGQLPTQPQWFELEPNSYGDAGATITTVARTPISRNRQNRKGTITDLDSQMNFEADLTISSLEDFAEGFIFARARGGAKFTPTAVTGTAYTVASGGALPAGRLVFARGFITEANNGLKVVGAGSTATAINVSGLTAEPTPPNNVEVAVCGVRAAAGDIQVNAQGNLTSTTLDFTTLGLLPGQAMFIGGAETANQFANAANRGFVRVRSVAANLITLDKRNQDFVTDNGSGKQIDLYFGRFIRNVPVGDPDYIQRSYQFEISYPGLGASNEELYEYLRGNFCNELAIDLPLTNKSTASFGFIGTDSGQPVATRAANAANAALPNKATAFNTTADIARLRVLKVDETGISSDFKSLSITLNNNVGPEKVIGLLGARFMNAGNFQVSIEAQMLFTSPDVIAAIRANDTLTLDFVLRNADGALFFDLPSVTLGGGGREFPVNESVLINVTSEAFADPVLNTSIGLSIFPYVPAAS